ncbi:hypothetical protein RF11_08400 [Thelohanellus kitauei]|uniref:Uncharacterized protein n=1 Tax=Thelohanellus kitauei TaxID=669202 RepID=A0A0C2N8W1_THEKT|nr:hypothetical protein RF11_08400 [Thelohanellus kitauei]
MDIGQLNHSGYMLAADIISATIKSHAKANNEAITVRSRHSVNCYTPSTGNDNECNNYAQTIDRKKEKTQDKSISETETKVAIMIFSFLAVYFLILVIFTKMHGTWCPTMESKNSTEVDHDNEHL